MTALDGAVTLVQVHCVAQCVRKDLDLDVPAEEARPALRLWCPSAC